MSKPDDGKFTKNRKSPSEDESRKKTAGSPSSNASSQSSPAKPNSIAPKNINLTASPSTNKKLERQKHVSSNDEDADKDGSDNKVNRGFAALKSPPAASKQPIENDDDEGRYSAEDESEDDIKNQKKEKKEKKTTLAPVHLERRKKEKAKNEEPEESERDNKKITKEKKEAPIKSPSLNKSSPGVGASTVKKIDSTAKIKAALKPPPAVSKQPIENDDDEERYSAEDESEDDIKNHKKEKKITPAPVHLERRKKEKNKNEESEKVLDNKIPQAKTPAEPQKEKERALHLYRFKTKAQAQTAEMKIQKRVNHKFLRLGLEEKQEKISYQIYKKLLEVNKQGVDNNQKKKVPTSFSDLQEWQKLAIRFYNQDSRVILLDGYTARSIIVGISIYLNRHGHIPTCVFGIGTNRMLCVSNSSNNQKGNFIIQAIHRITSEIVFVPSVYGNGNGKLQYSVVGQLIAITQANPMVDLYRNMLNKNKPISSFSGIINNADHVRFLNQLHLLHSILETARRCYLDEETRLPAVEVDALPICISQARTLQLLSDKRITIHDAFGWDTQGKYYPEKETSDHKAPFNAVAGKNVVNNVAEVENKVKRINDAYNERYQTYKIEDRQYLIEGPRLLRAQLGGHYGSGGESDGSDYSASESDVAGEKIVYNP